jgi:hypothetical protein
MIAIDNRNGHVPSASPNGFMLDHYRTFSGVINTFSQTYSARWSEAAKDSRENALAMRRDAYLMALLQERKLQCAQLGWHIEPENAKDPAQKVAAERVTKIISSTPQWNRLTMYLLEALWYGRYGAQLAWSMRNVNGSPALAVANHAPVNGDKIQFGWDGVPSVRVYHPDVGKLPGAETVISDAGVLLRLRDPRWRQRFVIHKHEIDDADYFEPEMAGSVHGVGLRDRIYWCWYLRAECLGWVMNVMKKVGTLGLLLFYYDEGNDAQKTAAEAAAQDAGERYALAVPRPRSDKSGPPAELLPANPAGVEAMTQIVGDYFERHMERLIIGQTLSGNAESTGMGSSVADLHADTKYRILKYDAENLADTLTEDLVAPIQQWNRLGAGCRLRFVFDVPIPGAKDQLEACQTVVSLGIPVKVDEVRGFAGLSKPEPADEIVGGRPAMPPPGQGQPMPFDRDGEQVRYEFEEWKVNRKGKGKGGGQFAKKGEGGAGGGTTGNSPKTKSSAKELDYRHTKIHKDMKGRTVAKYTIANSVLNHKGDAKKLAGLANDLADEKTLPLFSDRFELWLAAFNGMKYQAPDASKVDTADDLRGEDAKTQRSGYIVKFGKSAIRLSRQAEAEGNNKLFCSIVYLTDPKDPRAPTGLYYVPGIPPGTDVSLIDHSSEWSIDNPHRPVLLAAIPQEDDIDPMEALSRNKDALAKAHANRERTIKAIDKHREEMLKMQKRNAGTAIAKEMDLNAQTRSGKIWVAKGYIRSHANIVAKGYITNDVAHQMTIEALISQGHATDVDEAEEIIAEAHDAIEEDDKAKSS